MIRLYLAPFIIGTLISGALTFYARLIAQKYNAVDLPSPRKIHNRPIPRMGGVAIVAAFLFLTLGYALISPRLNFGSPKFLWIDVKLWGVILGALVITTVGIIDDIKGVIAWKKFFWQVMSAVLVVIFGLSIDYIRIPGGYHIDLNTWIVPINLFGQNFSFSVWGDLITIFWIVLMINTVNFLDGLDGLAGGISFIAAIVLFLLSLTLGQLPSALLCIILAGSILGFLPWNFNPAKIFLGDSGSMFLGFMLGILSVISGGKLATAFLVLGIPLLDVGWVVIRRTLSGQSPFVADKLHLHHRLLTAGLNQRQAVIILYFTSAMFGVVALFSRTDQKFSAMLWLLAVMIVLGIALIVLGWIKKRRQNA